MADTALARERLDLASIEVSLLALLRKAWAAAVPPSVVMDAESGAIAFSAPGEWELPVADLERAFDAIAGERASLRLIYDADCPSRVELMLRGRELETLVVVNGLSTSLDLAQGARLEAATLNIGGAGTLTRLALRAAFTEVCEAEAEIAPAPAAEREAPPPPAKVAPVSKQAAPPRSLDAFVLTCGHYATRLAKLSDLAFDAGADVLSLDKEKHDYVWLSDIAGLFEALAGLTGETVEMTLEGVVRGAASVEAFLGLKYDGAWRNVGARPNYPVAVRLGVGFTDLRVGLRLVGRGSVEKLKIKFKLQPELEAPNRLALRRLMKDATPVGRLKAALIGDPFTLENFDGVVEPILIRPNDWRALLKLDPPDFLFVESAWVGNDGAWSNRIVNNIEELEALTRWCRGAGIPSIFWNKEDPIHFHRFLKAARLFDHVYTTCAESVRDYEKQGIKAKVLPFSVNLATYNPLGGGRARERHAVFAGAWYGQKYPERTADMERMLDLCRRYGLRIFDRNAGATSDEYAFPERFRAAIIGKADARRLDKEYKRARIAINVNTVKDSTSMFARRAFEVAITGTPMISNFSPALEAMFGDGLVASDDFDIVAREVALLFEDESHWRRRRRSLMRTTLMRHTIKDRLQTILSDLDAPVERPGARVAVFGDHPAGVNLAPESFPNSRVLEAREAATPLWQMMPAGAQYAAVALHRGRWDAEVLDEFLRHQDYARADLVGEAQGGEAFRFGGELRKDLLLMGRDALSHGEFTLADLKAENFADRVRELGLKTFGVERLSEPRASPATPLSIATPRPILDWWADARDLTLHQDASGWVAGRHENDMHTYLRVGDRHRLDAPPETSLFPPQDFGEGIALTFAFEGAAEAGLHVLFYRDDKLMSTRVAAANMQSFVRAPEGWTHAALAIRIKGKGDFRFRVTLERELRTAQDFVARALGERLRAEVAWLCLSSVYPRADNLYRNAFVHTRVKSYLGAGHETVVASMEGADAVLSTYEFEGVLVFAGAGAGLADVLRARRWDRVACHIVSREMLRILDAEAPASRKVVWIHAIEAERWHRRAFDVDLEAAGLEGRLRKLYEASDERNGAVRLVYQRSGRSLADCRVIFVSNWFRENIGCIDVRPPPGDWRVIHNPIAADLFAYRRKRAQDRFHWMSVRPYVSRAYGNDMTVAAILALSVEPWFDQVRVTLVGRGPLFDETVAPLRGFQNVTLENRFLRQAEIAEYHSRHGLYIGPTRADSQGVSLGEAMSSGLVPVSNHCRAIPEFVSPEWGLLAPAEDAAGLAACIKRLVEDPELFLELSEKVSRHIQDKCGAEKILAQEIAALTDP